MKRVSATDATRLRQLEQRLGSRTVRTILGSPDKRIMRPDRLANLTAGRGKLSAVEQERLDLLSKNTNALGRLKEKRTTDEIHGRKRKDWKVNRSLRDWLQHGKERDTPRPTTDDDKQDEQKAIRGLRFLGVDPSEKHFYVRKVAKT